MKTVLRYARSEHRRGRARICHGRRRTRRARTFRSFESSYSELPQEDAVPTIELTRFRVEPRRVADLLRARAGMLADFRADRDGFLDAHLVQLPDDEWLDIVTWRYPEDFAASR